MSEISFKGNFISHLNIQKIYPIKMPFKVSVVELNPLDNRDLRALRDVDDLWEASFSGNIYKEAASIHNIGEADEAQKFYVLTRQMKNFENIFPDDILAEAKIAEDSFNGRSVNLDYLQVHPEHLYDSEVREFKGLGRGFLDFFKQLYKGKEIDLHSVFSARDFYFKNGFHPVERDSNNLYFIA